MSGSEYPRPLAPGTVLLPFEWLHRPESPEHADAAVARVFDAIAEAGLGKPSIEQHHGKAEGLEILDCALNGDLILDGELQLILHTAETTLWQPNRLQLRLPPPFAGPRADCSKRILEQLGTRLDCDAALLSTAHMGSFTPHPFLDAMGQPPPCWLILLGMREYGPAERYRNGPGTTTTLGDGHHILIEAASPPWDHDSVDAACALREIGSWFRGLDAMSKTVVANLSALEREVE